MNILALDTCFNICSVALLCNDKVITFNSLEEPNRQAEMIVHLIDNCLRKEGVVLEDIDHIIVTNGPGAFTGVRIGLACALGLQKGMRREVKIQCLSTFEVAWHANDYKSCCISFKAARERYYFQKFDENGPISEPMILLVKDMERMVKGQHIVNTHPSAKLAGLAYYSLMQKNYDFAQKKIEALYIGIPDAYSRLCT